MDIGEKAPDFLGLDENGNEVRTSDFRGRKLALYFYPKELTPGCTAQACNLRDNHQELLAKGYEVLGVSVNDGKTHQRFIARHGLPFHLIADTESRLAATFGVWGEKRMYGRTYMGTFRTTFIISEDGIVERIIGTKEINVRDHAAQILAG